MFRYFFVFLIIMQHDILSMAPTKQKLGLNITKLKGTHEILKDYPGYAPFWGLVFAEKDVAKNLYTFSTHNIKKEANIILKSVEAEWDPLKKTVEGFLQDKQNTATQNLVRQMFHEIGGTFNITNAPNNPVAQFTPEHLGKILRLVHDAGSDYVKMEASLKEYLLTLKLQCPKGKNFPGKDFNPFIKGLVGAVQECSIQNPQAIFAPNTAHGIILGYLLWKSNDRADLQKYFTGFLGKLIILPEEQYTAKEFAEIVKQDLDLQDTKQFADFICAMIYPEKYVALFPKLAISKMVTFKGVSFPDCVDSTMLNLVNIVTYNQAKALLGHPPKGLEMAGVLIKFYNQHADPSNITHVSVNQAWTEVVQNVPGVAYNRLVEPETKTCVGAISSCDGFMPVDVVDKTLPVKIVQLGSKNYQVYEKQVGDQKYWLVEKESGLVCCELMPTESNVIVLMNNLFNLSLYSNFEAIFDPHFTTNYFTTMCQKFDWTVVGQSSDSIVISILDGKQFTIHLYHNQHAYISTNEAKAVVDTSPDVAKLSQEKQAICKALGLETDFDLKNLFYMDLLNVNKRLEIVKECIRLDQKKYAPIIDNFVLSFNSQQDDYYQAILFDLYAKYPLKSIKDSIIMNALKYKKVSHVMNFLIKYDIADFKNNFLLYVKLAIDGDDIRKALGIINANINSDSIFDKSNATQIVSCIQIAIDKNEIISALRLACSAVKKGLFDKSNVAQIVSWIQLSMDEFQIYNALELARSAVEKGLFDKSNVTQIVSWIQIAIDKNEIRGALGLVRSAVEKGLFDKSNVTQIALWIQVCMDKSQIDWVLGLVRSAVEKGLFDKSNVTQIVSWIQVIMDKSQISWALELARSAVEKDLFDKSNVTEMISLIKIFEKYKNFSNITSDSVNELKELLISKGLIDENMNPTVPQRSIMSMKDTAIGRKPISKTQMNNIRAGLPQDLQPLQPRQQEFTPPSAKDLEQQRLAIENFNQNQQAQSQVAQPKLQTLEGQPPLQELGAPIQSPGMLVGPEANINNVLRRGIRSVRR